MTDTTSERTFVIRLQSFTFPEKLGGSKANFRFIVDLRYSAGGEFSIEHAVMPNLDTYWECDPGQKDAPNFVRMEDQGKWKPNFDMSKIDEWDCLVLSIKAENLHAVQVKVIDVDRKDVFDKLKGAFQGILEGCLGMLRTRISARLPQNVLQNKAPQVNQVLGGAADDIEAFLLKKLAGGDDVLFRGSSRIINDEIGDQWNPLHVTISGKGTAGIYAVGLTVAESG